MKKFFPEVYDSNITNKVWEFFMNEIPKIGYEAREGQEDMALDICEAIKDNEHIIIEAGVGIGKSYAYLVPLIYYNKLTSSPVVISTSTILLQEQLINDIITISKRLHIYPEVVLAKGMTHFKCMRRAMNYLEENEIDTYLSQWIKDADSGDRIELQEPVTDNIWKNININTCEYRCCDMYNKCYYMKRRSKMLNTNGIILCNHDLLTVDLKRKENHERDILSPSIKLIVVDEAHNLEEKVRNLSKEIYTYNETNRYINEAITYLKRSKNEVEIDINSFDIIKDIYEDFKVQIIQQREGLGKSDGDIERYYLRNGRLKIKINNIINLLKDLNIKVQLVDSGKFDDKQENIIENLEKLLRLFKELLKDTSDNLFWIEIINAGLNIRSIKVIKCPKTINTEINSLFFSNYNFKTILTSATLTNSSDGDDELKYKYIVNTLGFPINNNGILSTPKESPYEYNKNSIIYYREDMPHPTKERDLFIENSVDVIVELIKLTKGKTMILFTSKCDMVEVYNKLKETDIKWKIIKQEDGITQDSIIQEFKNDENSILLGTGSYWEGVSIEGKALSSLIIFKLPFPVPDPVIDYKRTLSERPLMEVDVPEMIIKLKQGAGRLIRNSTDNGIVTILDPRINDKSTAPYKKLVWDSLPMKIKTNNIDTIENFINKNSID